MSDLWETFEAAIADFNDIDRMLAARWLLSDVKWKLEMDQSTDQRLALDVGMGACNLAISARYREFDTDDDR